jgi:hypothetical protein
MSNWFFWLIILMGVLGPLFFLAGTIRKLFLGWRTPTTWISALPGQGWVQVVGRGRGEAIKSPVRQTDCIYWNLEVQEYHGGRGGGWRSAHKESSGSFELNDMTGRINIQKGDIDFFLNSETVITDLGVAERAMVEGYGIKTKGLLGIDKKIRIFERIITSDEEITVLGRIQKTEGQISISGGSILPEVISNMSKEQMLKAIFWRDIRPRLFSLVVSLLFIAFYLYIITR